MLFLFFRTTKQRPTAHKLLYVCQFPKPCDRFSV